MAPSGKRIKARRSTRKSRRTQCKKPSENEETSVDLVPANSSTITHSKASERKTYPTCNFQGCNNQTQENQSFSAETNGACYDVADDQVISSGCSTPKGQRFRVPEILTCPPAPKKRRVLSNCSIRRTPIAFFAPPDIELFFLFALGHVPA